MPTTEADRTASVAPPAGRSRGDAIEGLFAVALTVIGTWSWIGVVLAETGVFRLWAIVSLAAPLSAIAGAWIWRELRRDASGTPRLALAGASLVVAVAVCLVARPGEYLVDGGDGSVYLNIGRSLARDHALIAPDRLLALIPSSDWGALFQQERLAPYAYNFFPGGVQLYPGVNGVEPNFFHMLPVWVGVASLVGGSHAAYYVSPFFGVIATLAFWLVVRHFASTWSATATTLLLLANYAQIWFMRVPTTEVMAQAFVLSGLYFTASGYRDGGLARSVLGALAFGLAAFVRIDVLFFVTPLAFGCLALAALERKWATAWTWPALMLSALTAHAIVHAAVWSRPYSERILHHMFAARAVSTASRLIPPLILLLGAVALTAAWRFRERVVVRRAMTLLFVAALAGAVVRIWPQVSAGYLPMVISPLGLALAAAGCLVLLREDGPPPAWLVVGLLLTSALVYGESVRDRGALPMVLRRFVPVIVPLSLLATGVVIDRLWRGGRVLRATSGLAWVGLLAIFLAHSWTLPAMSPMTGVHEDVARLAAALPPDAIVVTDKTTPSHLGLSLRGTFGRDVLWVTPSGRSGLVLQQMATRARRPVVVIRAESGTGGALSGRDLVGFAMTPPHTVTLRTLQIEERTDRLPTELVEHRAVLELHSGTPRAAVALPATIEIGAGDLPGRLSGFFDAEQMGTASARWTHESAQLQLPRVAGAATGLSLRLAAPRRAASAGPTVTVAIDGVTIGTTPALAPSFEVVELVLDERSRERLAEGPAVLTLTVPTFVPAEVGMGNDTRHLGAVVDWVRVNGQ